MCLMTLANPLTLSHCPLSSSACLSRVHRTAVPFTVLPIVLCLFLSCLPACVCDIYQFCAPVFKLSPVHSYPSCLSPWLSLSLTSLSFVLSWDLISLSFFPSLPLSLSLSLVLDISCNFSPENDKTTYCLRLRLRITWLWLPLPPSLSLSVSVSVCAL